MGDVAEPWRYHLLTAREREIGERIRERRRALRWSLESVAAETGLSASVISGYERCEHRVPSERLAKIASALGVTVAYLRDGTE
jgi:transcriptional regulator with XRE-family HTH domain